MKNKILKLLILFIFLFNSAPLRPETIIKDISNQKYYPAVLQQIKGAKESIYMVMYLISIIPNQTDTPPHKLTQELINAHKRGVKIKVILDYHKSGKYEEGQTSYNAYKMLKNAGINVSFDTPEIYTHNKAIIIDKETVIIGSANWSTAALTENNETNIIIKSPELANQLIDQISKIKLLTPYTETNAVILIPYDFMSADGQMQEMVRRHARKSFDAYLSSLLLQQSDKKNTPSFKLPKSYWDYKWDKRLALNEKAILLLLLAELGPKPIGLEINESRKKLSKKYGIHEWTISQGLTGLKNYNIIEIEYSDPDKGYEHRAPMKIKFNGLYDWDSLQNHLTLIKNTYGKETFNKAKKYASIICMQNNGNKIEEIIKLMQKYGTEKIDKAFKIISQKAPDNPKRSLKYVVGILKQI